MCVCIVPTSCQATKMAAVLFSCGRVRVHVLVLIRTAGNLTAHAEARNEHRARLLSSAYLDRSKAQALYLGRLWLGIRIRGAAWLEIRS